jgi:transglutaminase-like putative cysteine protease
LRYTIEHRTEYTYDSPVFLNPHVLRLKPRTDAAQRLLRYSRTIEPEPVGLTENIDLDGTDTTLVWFEGRTERFVIETAMEVETLRENAYDFLWRGDRSLPVRYTQELQSLLGTYRSDTESEIVRDFAQEIVHEAEGDAQAFLPLLARAISAHCRQITRPEGAPYPAEETLDMGEGSCRDLTVLFMECARAFGFAARFVSGYHAVPANEHDLHAWAEVYEPGGGWRGFDPSAGLAVAGNHIALAATSHSRASAPIQGTLRGRATSTLETSVVIRQLD